MVGEDMIARLIRGVDATGVVGVSAASVFVSPRCKLGGKMPS